MNTPKDLTAVEAIREMLANWTRIQTAARKLLPHASDEEVDLIA